MPDLGGITRLHVLLNTKIADRLRALVAKTWVSSISTERRTKFKLTLSFRPKAAAIRIKMIKRSDFGLYRNAGHSG